MKDTVWWVRMGRWFASLPWWAKFICGLPVFALVLLGFLVGRRSRIQVGSTGAAVERAADTIGHAISEADNVVREENAKINGRATERSDEMVAIGGSSDALGDALVGFWRRRKRRDE